MAERTSDSRPERDENNSIELETIAETQKRFGGESRSSIYRALQRKELEAVKRGRRTLITVASANRRFRNLPNAIFKSA